jgi:periplasmic protein TonB
LLFKSARNSASNQSSLAVAVVEGQAGVAKAFRIGANLVLTKPINIEQAKGTLRVARGLLRKSEGAKPAAAAAAAASTPTKAHAIAPATQAAPAPTTARPPAAPPAKPTAAWPGQPAAAPSPAGEPEPAAPKSSVPSARPPAAPPAKIAAPPPASRLPVPATPAAAAKAVLKPAAASFGSGAATAPAPARDPKPAPAAAIAEASPDLFESPSAEALVPANPAPAANPTAFTFGGNATAEGGSKKNLLIIAAAVVVAALAYAGWGYFSAHRSAPMINPVHEAQPNTSRPAPSMSTPAPAPKAQTPPVQATPVPVTPATSAVSEHKQPVSDADDSEDSADSDKTSASAPAKKAAAKPAPAPLVVKGGTVQGIAKTAAPDAPAPSVIGMAAPGTSGPLPNLVGSNSAARPVLQRMNLSQGVSAGLLIKKVSPAYPPTALHMRIEGSVQLQATISKTGDITEVKVLSGDKQLTRAATDAVKQWKYKPYLLNGDPVEIQTQITINFKLPQ